MELLRLGQITVRARQRSEISSDKVIELSNSISKVGLMHPVVVTPEGVLVAGERRLAAMTQLHNIYQPFRCNGAVVPADKIPCIRITDLDEIGFYEAELEENLRRENLTWQEERDALVALHEMRTAGAEARGEKPTQQEAANIFAAAKGTSASFAAAQLSRALATNTMRDDADVNDAPTLKAAAKIALRKADTAHHARMQAASGQNTHRYQLHRLSFERWRDIEYYGPDCPEFSLIIADPPYNIGADEFGNAAENPHKYADDNLVLAKTILTDCFNACGEDAHLFLFCDIEHFLTLRIWALDEGWFPQRTPLIWYKGESGHAPQGSGGIRRTYECILAASKGGRKYTSLFSDVIRDIPAPREKRHAAEKPAALYSFLMSKAVLADEWVLDPCCGSGPVFEAAHERGVKAVGIEPNAEYAAMAQARMHEKELNDG